MSEVRRSLQTENLIGWSWAGERMGRSADRGVLRLGWHLGES